MDTELVKLLDLHSKIASEINVISLALAGISILATIITTGIAKKARRQEKELRAHHVAEYLQKQEELSLLLKKREQDTRSFEKALCHVYDSGEKILLPEQFETKLISKKPSLHNSLQSYTNNHHTTHSPDQSFETVLFIENVEMIDNKLSNISTITSEIAHSLKTPLSALTIILENIDKKCISKKTYNDIKEILQSINDTIRGYQEMAEESLSDGKFHLKQKINGTLKAVALSTEKKVNFDIDVSETCLISAAEYQVLSISIICLLENAIDVTKDNGVISVVAKNFENETQINITNYGSTIPVELSSEIYKHSFSTKNSTGLGLAIAKKAIESINGKLTHKCDYEKQLTSFSISIPRGTSRDR